MKWGLVVSVVHQNSPRPSYDHLHFLFTSHFLRACLDQRWNGNEAAPMLNRPLPRDPLKMACVGSWNFTVLVYFSLIDITFSPSRLLFRYSCRGRRNEEINPDDRAISQFKSLINLLLGSSWSSDKIRPADFSCTPGCGIVLSHCPLPPGINIRCH